ncbi:MAG TPA: zinc ribbon domain-containing protein [Tepidisphaeraceae bacterium]|nr:zinc ribbon domain-containing protein [Tepidisphaeraceae bacterium]
MEESAQVVLNGQASPSNPSGSSRPARLGEELPVFCEQCGYTLHGLPPARCEHCQILYFRCPECGHTQPINTLRPAVQRMLGVMRAWLLGFWVLVKINFFVWMLFAWAAMGYEWSYSYRMTTQRPTVQSGVMTYPAGGGSGGRRTPQYYVAQLRPTDIESILSFSLLGLSFGMVARMLLLNWRRNAAIGAVLAGLVAAAILCGAALRQQELKIPISPLEYEFAMMIGLAAGFVIVGTVLVFPVWSGFVRLLLPKRTASALLEWQTNRPAALCSPNSQQAPRFES